MEVWSIRVPFAGTLGWCVCSDVFTYEVKGLRKGAFKPVFDPLTLGYFHFT